MLGQQPGASLDGMPGSVASNRERRRLSIKAAKVERRREAEEIAIMQLEDERSRLENEAYLVSVYCSLCLQERSCAGLDNLRKSFLPGKIM